MASAAEKSRVANGTVVLPRGPTARRGGIGAARVERTSVQVRRYREIFQAVCADQGGVERMSEVRLRLARRLTAASVMAEDLERKHVNGEAIDVEQHALLASTSLRLGGRLGLERVAKDVPSLSEYLAGLRAEDEAASEAATDRQG
jgi:hypothetical protein